jgi:hypothetical protein
VSAVLAFRPRDKRWDEACRRFGRMTEDQQDVLLAEHGDEDIAIQSIADTICPHCNGTGQRYTYAPWQDNACGCNGGVVW